jgi:pyrroline-5-carboxylate reductase
VGSPLAKLEAIILNKDSNSACGFSRRGASGKFYIKRAMLNIAAEFRELITIIETTDIPQEYEEIIYWIFP